MNTKLRCSVEPSMACRTSSFTADWFDLGDIMMLSCPKDRAMLTRIHRHKRDLDRTDRKRKASASRDRHNAPLR